MKLLLRDRVSIQEFRLNASNLKIVGSEAATEELGNYDNFVCSFNPQEIKLNYIHFHSLQSTIVEGGEKAKGEDKRKSSS